MEQFRRCSISALLLTAITAAQAAAAPRVENPSFEADVFGVYPGVARVNGAAAS